MPGIDNNFVNNYREYKRNGLDQNELRLLRNAAASGLVNQEAARLLQNELVRDGQLDQDEQKLL